jgi:cobalt-zinc-cadmium efflux system membrane fusion protein
MNKPETTSSASSWVGRAVKNVGAASLCVLVGVLFGQRGKSDPAPVAPVPAKVDDKLRLSALATQKNRIDTVAAVRVFLARDVEVVGSVSYDADHFAEVGPLIAGRIVSLEVGIGDKVKAGQLLAALESAEVGQAQAAYLTARAATVAAQANLRREKELAERRVSSERERELAEAAAATEEANLAAATQRLRALGLRAEDIKVLERTGGWPGRVPLVSPIDGVVITREVSLGQSVQSASDAFRVANLSWLWVVLDLFEKDLSYVHKDQKVVLRTEAYPGRTFPARVAYVGQVIDEKTRTAPVRVEFQNPDGLFRPGQFVTATLVGDPSLSKLEVLAVPRKAIQTVEGKPIVFVAESDGSFGKRNVELGISGGGQVEVRSGLSVGERVAADGGFLLKSELLR